MINFSDLLMDITIKDFAYLILLCFAAWSAIELLFSIIFDYVDNRIKRGEKND